MTVALAGGGTKTKILGFANTNNKHSMVAFYANHGQGHGSACAIPDVDVRQAELIGR